MTEKQFSVRGLSSQLEMRLELKVDLLDSYRYTAILIEASKPL